MFALLLYVKRSSLCRLPTYLNQCPIGAHGRTKVAVSPWRTSTTTGSRTFSFCRWTTRQGKIADYTAWGATWTRTEWPRVAGGGGGGGRTGFAWKIGRPGWMWRVWR